MANITEDERQRLTKEIEHPFMGEMADHSVRNHAHVLETLRKRKLPQADDVPRGKLRESADHHFLGDGKSKPSRCAACKTRWQGRPSPIVANQP
ncbi:hypothetical protein DK37_18155 [Halomonas sp. SUBG004]|nr:hypothetical protein DK37_18155 [Halomonas sp. SUBG004]